MIKKALHIPCGILSKGWEELISANNSENFTLNEYEGVAYSIPYIPCWELEVCRPFPCKVSFDRTIAATSIPSLDYRLTNV